MKTSNKLIAGIFFLAVLMPVLVVGAIIIKFKSGDFTWEKEEPEFQTKYFPGKKYIKVRSNDGLEVYPADSLYVEIGQRYDFPVRLKQVGDTVLLYGDTAYYHYDTARNGAVTKEYIETQSNETIRLYLPQDVNLIVENSDFLLLNDNKNYTVDHLDIRMKNATISTHNYDSIRTQVNKFSLKMEKSEVNFGSHWQINELDLDLTAGSKISISDCKVEMVRLSIDSTSTFNSTGHQFKKVIQK